jgi:hypothetical protein
MSDKKNTSAVTKAAEVKTRKIVFTLSPCGKFKLPYNVGQEVELSVNEATEIVESKYAEFVN